MSEGRAEERLISSISMTLVLISFSMLFATLFLGFFIVRSRSVTWPPMGIDPVPITIPSCSTLLMALSSLAYVTFERFYRSGKRAAPFLGLSFLLGLGFMVSQFVFWQELEARGIYADSGVFGSFLYGLTWAHGAHVLLGLILLGHLVFYLRKEGDIALRIGNVGNFWHFLGIVWTLMFVILFIY